MPKDGFVRTALFFQAALSALLADGFITQEEINAVAQTAATRSTSER
jgi:hypothetical protein